MRSPRKRRTRRVGQALIRAHAVGDARGEAAAAEHVVHHLDRVVVRVVPADARQYDRHAALVHILIDNVHSRLAVLPFLRHRRRFFTGVRPGGEHAVEPLEHRFAIEVAADRHDEVSRMHPLVVERQKILPANSLERRGRRVAVEPKVLAVREEVALARLDVS